MKRTLALLLTAALLSAGLLACEKSPSQKRTDAVGASVKGQAARTKPFVASVLREPFHEPDCKWAKKISSRNFVGYDTREAAIAGGHRPCKVCWA